MIDISKYISKNCIFEYAQYSIKDVKAVPNFIDWFNKGFSNVGNVSAIQ